MVLGPCWNSAGDQPPAESAPAGVADVVHAVAVDLAADLTRAEQLTGGWNSDVLGFRLIDAALSRSLARLAETGCWGRANQPLSGELWRQAGRWLETSPLVHRARFKPRGYAGDHQMLAQVCAGICCDHPSGRLFDRFFLGQAAVCAVRSRTEQIAAALAEHCLSSEAVPYRAVSVGAGPALDIELAVQALPARRRQQVSLTLLDLDEEALEFAKRALSELLPAEQIHGVRENLYRLADKSRAAEPLRDADFLTCSGLFDYLPWEAAVKLLRLFWAHLRPGGMLLVGNFAPHNPSRAYMEWIGHWYLIYRTRSEMEQMALAAGIPAGSFNVGAESLGIDLFLQACKPQA